jgi:hypothetical protein
MIRFLLKLDMLDIIENTCIHSSYDVEKFEHRQIYTEKKLPWGFWNEAFALFFFLYLDILVTT